MSQSQQSTQVIMKIRAVMGVFTQVFLLFEAGPYLRR